MTLLNVINRANEVRKQIEGLAHNVDVYEAIASTSVRCESIERIGYDLRILRRDIERLNEMIDERRARIRQLDKVA